MKETPPERELTHNGIKIEIHQDTTGPQSPSDWANEDLFLVANHRDCYIPEPGEKRITNDPGELVSRWKDTHHIFGLEAYIHGDVRLALSGEGNFPDRRWDVSQLGFVFASKKEWRMRKSACKAAESLIKEWNMYFSGDIWGFIVAPGERDEESCWGFYGFDYCLNEAKAVATIIAKARKREAKEAGAMACRGVLTV